MSGVRERRYEFAIRAAFIVSDAYGDNRNTNCMRTLRNWLNWVREQERRGNYPDLGRRRGGYELRNIDDAPQMALINGNMAIFSCRSALLYMEG
jgi:hypothetical protein